MERQKSFSVKPTRLLVFTFTILSSVTILSFFSVWIVNSNPSIRQETHLQFNGSSLNVKSMNIQTLTGFVKNFSSNSGEDSIVIDAPLRRPQHTSGVTVVSDLKGQHSEEKESTVPEDEQSLSGLSRNLSADGAKDSVLVDNPFTRSENGSGISVISEFKEQYSTEDESVMLEDEADNEDVEDTLALEQDLTPEPSNEGIEVQSSEKVEEKYTEASSLKKNEVPSSENKTEEKKSRTDSIKEIAGRVNVKIEEKSTKDCDFTKGRWVYDESYPLYTSVSCPFIDEGFSCESNGRLDKDYMKWKWKPEDCDIPRFDAKKMLELLRGKRLVFVGDSINRNQWESMLCMLMQAVEDPKKVYETHGRRITKSKGNYCFKFVDYKCTVEYYVSHFLVHESKARIGQKRRQTLRIDTIDRGSSRWRGADILIFNTAHWWSHYKTKSGINYYQEGDQVHPKLDVSTAFRRALTTWASWVDKYINRRKTQVFFRSSAPSHFRGGKWNSGGHCMEATQPLNISLGMGYPEKNIIAEEVIKQMKTHVTVLNITGLSEYRIDGHPSIYGRKPGNKYSSSIQDCSHWCLPGVPDIWNELLYFHLQSKQTTSFQ